MEVSKATGRELQFEVDNVFGESLGHQETPCISRFIILCISVIYFIKFIFIAAASAAFVTMLPTRLEFTNTS